MTADARRRIVLAEAIAERWNRARIPYTVAHGLHGYPERLGRDLDLTIEREHVWPAARIALDMAKGSGFDLALFRWSHYGLYQLALIDPINLVSLPIDLRCTTGIWRAKWVRLADKPALDRLVRADRQTGPFTISTEGHFLKACVRPLLCGDLRRFGTEFPLPVRVPEAVDRARLHDFIGDRGFALLGSTSLDALEAAFPAATGKLQRRWILRHPLGALRSLVDSLVGRFKRRLFNAADVILVETDDPEAVRRCLDDLVPEMKRMFIELRPVRADGGVLATLWGALYAWRSLPVSEFVVCVAVTARDHAPDCAPDRAPDRANGRIERRAGRRRWLLGADAVIRTYGVGDPAVLHDGLRARILDFMAARHQPPPSIRMNGCARIGP